jgi:TPR repeat protein
MVVSAFAILVAVFNSDVTRVLIDKARVSIGGATRGAVLGVLNNRSITPDPVMARDWYRKAASLGLAEAQQRLTQLQN